MPRAIHTKAIAPIHPGEVLSEDFLKPLGITQYRLAKGLRKSAIAVKQIVDGTRAISPDMALRLGRFFGTTPEFWLNLQSHYALQIAQQADAKDIERVEVFQHA